MIVSVDGKHYQLVQGRNKSFLGTKAIIGGAGTCLESGEPGWMLESENNRFQGVGHIE